MEKEDLILEELRKINSRLDKLEESTEAIAEIAASVKVIATEQKQISHTVDKLDTKVEALESKPGERYEQIAQNVIWALVAAAITFILSHLGL